MNASINAHRGRLKDLTLTVSGKQILTLLLSSDLKIDFSELEGKDLDISIKVHREKRSLDANAYFWTLCKKLADVIGKPSLEIYRRQILELNVYRDAWIKDDAVDTLIHVWEFRGLGWQAERVDKGKEGFSVIRLWYGSSVFNTRQMSRLIDNIVQDCKEQGIETKTPQELELLKAEWVPQK